MSRKLIGAALTTTLSDVYTVPSGKVADVYNLNLAYNGTAATAEVTIKAEVSATEYFIHASLPVTRASYTPRGEYPLQAGDKIRASCTATGCTLLLSVREVNA